MLDVILLLLPLTPGQEAYASTAGSAQPVVFTVTRGVYPPVPTPKPPATPATTAIQTTFPNDYAGLVRASLEYGEPAVVDVGTTRPTPLGDWFSCTVPALPGLDAPCVVVAMPSGGQLWRRYHFEGGASPAEVQAAVRAVRANPAPGIPIVRAAPAAPPVVVPPPPAAPVSPYVPSAETTVAVSAPVVTNPPALSGQIVTTPVVNQPVFSQPVFSQPVFSQPVFSQPVFSQPVFSQPVFQAAPAVQPNYFRAAQPAYFSRPVRVAGGRRACPT